MGGDELTADELAADEVAADEGDMATPRAVWRPCVRTYVIRKLEP